MGLPALPHSIVSTGRFSLPLVTPPHCCPLFHQLVHPSTDICRTQKYGIPYLMTVAEASESMQMCTPLGCRPEATL